MIALVLVVDVIVDDIRENVADISFDDPVGWVILVMLGLAVLVGPWVLVLGTRQLRQASRLFATESIGAGDVTLENGVVEVEGTARPIDETLTGRYTDESAVALKWHRERKRKGADDDDDSQRSWKTVSKGSEAVPFLVEDESGEVAVDPAGATLSISETRIRKSGWLRRREKEYREYEGRIEPGDDVYVRGEVQSAREADEAPGEDAAYIGSGDGGSAFVVSDGSKLRTVLRYVGLGLLLVVVAVLWIPLATVAFFVLVEEAFGLPIASRLVDLFG